MHGGSGARSPASGAGARAAREGVGVRPVARARITYPPRIGGFRTKRGVSMRSRGLKPGSFFLHELLGQVSFGARLLAAGLWCLSDRDGKMEFMSGVRLRAEVFPYDGWLSGDDVSRFLGELLRVGFAELHELDGKRYLLLPTFSSDQTPHHTEGKSKIGQLDSTTKAPLTTVVHGEFTVSHGEQKSKGVLFNDFASGDVGSIGRGGLGRAASGGSDDQRSVIRDQRSVIRGSEGGMTMLDSLQPCHEGFTPQVTVDNGEVTDVHGEFTVTNGEEVELGLESPPAGGPGQKRGSRRVVPRMYRWEEFCALYPRHRQKFTTRAEKLWDSLVSKCGTLAEADVLVDEVLAGLRLWVDSVDWGRDGGAYVPNPFSFLDGKQWRADPRAGGASGGKVWFDDEEGA